MSLGRVNKDITSIETALDRIIKSCLIYDIDAKISKHTCTYVCGPKVMTMCQTTDGNFYSPLLLCQTALSAVWTTLV